MKNKVIQEMGRNVKSQREAKGWSQSKLAIESHCSLATIQNIEAGRANPEIETLERVLSSLGQKIMILSRNIDFTFWPSLGLPLLDNEDVFVKPSKELLMEQMQLVELHLNQLKEERVCTAFASFLSGLKVHFPQVYSQLGGNIKQWLVKNEVIYCRPKLRRLSIERLALYL